MGNVTLDFSAKMGKEICRGEQPFFEIENQEHRGLRYSAQIGETTSWSPERQASDSELILGFWLNAKIEGFRRGPRKLRSK